MKLSRNSKLVIVALIILLILSLLLSRFWKYVVYVPVLWERLIALPAETPPEAYEKFKAALEKRERHVYLRYIVRDNRKMYRTILDDPVVYSHYTGQDIELEEQYSLDCEDRIICHSTAVYTYELEILEPYEEEIDGKKFMVPAGVEILEMRFVEIKPGHWQISDL